MKKTILASFLFVSALSPFVTTASSQTKQQHGPMVSASTKKPKAPNPLEGLGLTEKQQADIQAILSSQDKKQVGKQSKEDTRRISRQDQIITETREELARIKAVLTPEQYQKYLENCYVNAALARRERPVPRTKTVRTDATGTSVSAAGIVQAKPTGKK